MTHIPRLTSVVDTVRTEGVGWVWRRLQHRTPATAFGRAVHGRLRHALGAVLAPVRRLARVDARLVSPTVLYAFYDLQVSPLTHDAAWFVAGADRMRRQLNLDRVHFVVVPGALDGLRAERAVYEAAVDREARRWRLHNVVVAIFGLLPTGAGYTLLPDRQSARALRADAGPHVYPRDYEPLLAVGHHPSEVLEAARAGESELAVLHSPVQAQRFVDRWLAARLDGRRLVTITLRDYPFMPARNSDAEAWAAFARRLDRARYLPVFVLDLERTLDGAPPALHGFELMPEASVNVALRLALYERAFLNLGVNNGPILMAALAPRTRLLIFKMITASVPQTTEAFLEQLGFEVGGQLPFANPFQRLVWQDDRLEVIEREFAAMVSRIEAGGEVA
ncbi:MAG TPA: hypothetical protein VK548_23670 [Candidatus Acidoferrum sp.]|nr:hypothetical protein [Candidatus Acidoferrum sp.]